MQNVGIKVVWGIKGYTRSLAISPSYRAHPISYMTLIETMHLSHTL